MQQEDVFILEADRWMANGIRGSVGTAYVRIPQT